MQTSNLTRTTDEKFQDLAHKTPEMKQKFIHSINNMFIKLRAYPPNLWSSLKVKALSHISSLTTALGIVALASGLYCKCFWNKMGCIYKHTRPTSLPNNCPSIELQPLPNPKPETSDQLSS